MRTLDGTNMELLMGVLSQIGHQRHKEAYITLVSKTKDVSQTVNRTQHYHGQYASFAIIQDTE